MVGGGSKYYGHYKMTPPPQLQNTRCYLASPVCTFEWFIHIILLPCLSIHKTLWLVKEAVVVVGGSKYYGHYKMTPPNCRILDVTSLALFVHLSGLFISFYFHAFNT